MYSIEQTIELLKNSTYYYTIVIGMDELYTYVSPSYDRKFDFLGFSLTGQPFYITLHPDDIKICREFGMKCFENPGQAFPVLLRKHDGRGGFIYTHWEFRALFDEHNIPLGVFCIGYNITEHVATYSKLTNAELIIQKNTTVLNEIGFIQSHVIRKPLANIMGLLETLDGASTIEEYKSVRMLLKDSACELDVVIKSITDRIE